MKRFKQNTIFILLFVLITSFTLKKDKSYIGQWKGSDKGDIGYLTLTKSNYATFEFGGDIMGGNSYNHNGVNAALRYRVNQRKEPKEINFIIWDKKKAIEVGRLRGIYKMIDSSKMQMSINFSGSNYRPKDFINSIVFYRINE